jgi:hypothetical protein
MRIAKFGKVGVVFTLVSTAVSRASRAAAELKGISPVH